MKLYFAGNFPQLSDIEKERAFRDRIEQGGFDYNRLVSFSFQKETRTVLQLKKERKWRDPVFQEDGQWFFYDETWALSHGPYETEEKAREVLAKYVKWLEETIPKKPRKFKRRK